MGIPVSTLTRLISNGKMMAIQLPDGSFAVNERDIQRLPTKNQFGHLHSRRVNVSQAVERYKVPERTIRRWVDRKYIAVLRAGFGMELDEQDVAYCAEAYRARKQELGDLVGTRLFDEGGEPYQLEYPDLARRRRKKKSAE